MIDKKPEPNFELLAEAIFDIGKSLRLLGNGNIDRGDQAVGAVEGLAIVIRESSKEIAESLDGIAGAIRELADAMDQTE